VTQAILPARRVMSISLFVVVDILVGWPRHGKPQLEAKAMTARFRACELLHCTDRSWL
jgi:hypothetical protein